MYRKLLIVLITLLMLAACGQAPASAPETEAAPQATEEAADRPTDEASAVESEAAGQPTEEPGAQPTQATEEPVVVSYEGGKLPLDKDTYFSGSGACAACHAKMTDDNGRDVSTDTLWRAAPMANASRDPYWLATVRAESIAHPDLQTAIEDKCATCHMPMAHTTAVAEGGSTAILDDGFTSPDHPLTSLAADGVSCTVCHQIEAENFGEEESFSGHFQIDLALPVGERVNYGPHPVAKGQAQIMAGASGYLPVESPHIEQAELCATCHTLYTPTVDDSGTVIGEFPEQMPYLEWLNSSYVDSAACQICHMPQAAGEMPLSLTGGPPRGPVHMHNFRGGNAFLLTLLRNNGLELGVTADSAHFDANITAITEQLQNITAQAALENTGLDGSTLIFDVQVSSLIGHKFPTGFPSRRAWLHVTVSDGSGTVIFESGAVDRTGQITGNDNDLDGETYEPHYQTITSPEEVQIYESMMVDVNGLPTTTLLRGSGYVKDNRLLPDGFDKENAIPDIAVYGLAADDENFTSGGDTVTYRVDVGDAAGPFTVTVELLYQSIGFRWANNMRNYDAPEVNQFVAFYDAASNLPVVIASASVDIE